MERIVVFGGTGFIGRNLIRELGSDYEIVVISRQKRTAQKSFGKNVEVERLRRTEIDKITELVDGCKAVINLAGENVGSRWSDSKKNKIRDSRLDIDSVIVRAIRLSKVKPKVLIQGSAIGVYGFSRTDKELSEVSSLGQRGFLPKVAKSHEEAVKQLEPILRVVYVRTGMVLGKDGGAMPKLVLQFRLFAGGRLGNGKQWNSWIHIDDEIRAIKYLLENETCVGPYNLTAPNPVTNMEFSRALAKTMKKPNILITPGFILKLLFGSMAKELLLSGVQVYPGRLISDGFKFRYETIDESLNDIINNT